MATLDLRSQTKPTDGRQESQHSLDVTGTYTLVYFPPRRLVKSVSVIANDGAIYWKASATEGATPDANDRKVPQSADDQLFLLDPRDISSRRPPPYGIASTTGTVNCSISIQWR